MFTAVSEFKPITEESCRCIWVFCILCAFLKWKDSCMMYKTARFCVAFFHSYSFFFTRKEWFPCICRLVSSYDYKLYYQNDFKSSIIYTFKSSNQFWFCSVTLCVKDGTGFYLRLPYLIHCTTYSTMYLQYMYLQYLMHCFLQGQV